MCGYISIEAENRDKAEQILNDYVGKHNIVGLEITNNKCIKGGLKE